MQVDVDTYRDFCSNIEEDGNNAQCQVTERPDAALQLLTEAGVTYPAGEEGLEMGRGSAWL